MNRNTNLINILRFVLLAMAQIFVFNNFNFFGFINPMIYVLFLYWYPIKENKAIFILLSFLLGLTIDIFSDTLAIHTVATVSIAYFRPTIMRFCFGVNYEFQSFKLSNTTRAQQITFLALLIIVHHLIFFMLEIFSFANFLLILKKVFAVGSISFVLCLLFSSLFSVRRP